MAASAEEAFDALAGRVPELILTSSLLSPRDEAELADRLRGLDDAGAHVQTLVIPAFASPSNRSSRVGGFLGRLLGARPAPIPEGCDPAVFGEQLREYLDQIAAERGETPVAVTNGGGQSAQKPGLSHLAPVPAFSVESAQPFKQEGQEQETTALGQKGPKWEPAFGGTEWGTTEHPTETPSLLKTPEPAFSVESPKPESVSNRQFPGLEWELAAPVSPGRLQPSELHRESSEEAENALATEAIDVTERVDRLTTGTAAPPVAGPRALIKEEPTDVASPTVGPDSAEKPFGDDRSDAVDLDLSEWLEGGSGLSIDDIDQSFAIESAPTVPSESLAGGDVEAILTELVASLEPAGQATSPGPVAEPPVRAAATPPPDTSHARDLPAPKAVETADAGPVEQIADQLDPGWVELDMTRPDPEQFLTDLPLIDRTSDRATPPVVPSAKGREKKKKKKITPVRDKWGFFDPEQSGFGALAAKLDEYGG